MKKLLLTLVAALAGTGLRAAQDNTVEIVYNNTTATVIIASNISEYVTDASDGASHVKLTQSSSVDDKVGEITYILSGTSADGEFFLNGSYKATIQLNGLTLTNPEGPAINIQDGKRIKLSMKDGTTSTLVDGANDDYNGCLHCKGHLELKGKGTLNVTGNSRHAVYSKEYFEIKNSTLNILGAVKDAIHCKQYFYQESGTINITSAGDDGIQVELKDSLSTGVTKDHDDEDTGNFYQVNGTLNISGYAGKAIKADGTITYTGGKQNFDKTDTQENAAAGIAALACEENSATDGTYDLLGRRTASATHRSHTPGLILIKKGNKTTKKQIIK